MSHEPKCTGRIVIDATVGPPRVTFPGKQETVLYVKGTVREAVQDFLEMGFDVSWKFWGKW